MDQKNPENVIWIQGQEIKSRHTKKWLMKNRVHSAF